MLSPVTFAGMELENRAARSATATGKFEQNTGIPKECFYDFHVSLAKGHPGLMIMEHCFIEERGYAGHPQFGIHNDNMIQYHKRVIGLMREANPKIKLCCQLAHAGSKSNKPDKVEINTITEEQICEVVAHFGDAARRAQEAGYDCVQLHSAHTYFLSSSISDYYNKRTDKYKADDFLILRMALEAARKNATIPIGVKLQCDDFVDGCAMNAERAAKIIETLDFDFVEISGGGHGGEHKHSTIRVKKDGDFYYRHVLSLFNERKLTEKCPIIVTGGMDMGNAEEGLQMGACLIGFSRKFIRNDKFLVDGDSKECIRCNWCIRNFSTCEDGLRCVFDKKSVE